MIYIPAACPRLPARQTVGGPDGQADGQINRIQYPPHPNPREGRVRGILYPIDLTVSLPDPSDRIRRACILAGTIL